MLCSPPPATTLASSCAGSEGFCAPCCRRSSQRSRIHNRPKTGRTLLLHERPTIALLRAADSGAGASAPLRRHAVLTDQGQDLGGGGRDVGAGPVDRANPGLLEKIIILRRDDAAAHDEDVADTLAL